MPYWSEIEKMTVRRAPLPSYAPQSPAAKVYAELWGEIETRLALAPALPGVLTAASAAADAPPY